MRVIARCKLPRLGAVLASVLLGACPQPVRVPSAPAAAPGGGAPLPAPHAGVPYDIVAADSLLSIRVYRGGTLASVGHNHLIACHALAGTVYVPAQRLGTSLEMRIPVEELTVDEEGLRAAEASEDFAGQVPDSARAGTRRNMLGPALLDAEHSAQILVRTLRLESAAPTGEQGSGTVLAHLEVSVRGAAHTVSVPVSYQVAAGTVIASGETALSQSELGLTPFSALLGALQVQDQMRIRFHIVARAAPR
jgi:hypothetical protein